jgi:hypothetical protein
MEGYWKFHYEIGPVNGDGIAMLHDGELVGGDFEHVWTGTYEEDQSAIRARIRITPSVSSEEEKIMARDKSLIFSLRGFCSEDFAALEGSAEPCKDLRIAITMRKCKGAAQDLPMEPFGKKAA